jgi:Holliday junction resolvasome RuvABC DNA-binding subunit
MIAYLKGRLVERVGDVAVIDAGGVGYEVRAFNRALHLWQTVRNEDHQIFVVTWSPEGGAPSLLGFTNVRDKLAWLGLVDCGIDGDRALQLVELLTAQGVYDAVAAKDPAAFTRVPGVSGSDAKRVVQLLGAAPWTNPRFDHTTSGLAHRATPADEENTLFLTLGRLGYEAEEISQVKAHLNAEGVSLQDPLQDRLRAALNILYGKGS